MKVWEFFCAILLSLCLMRVLYNITIYIVRFFLRIIALFNNKIRFFVNGRKESFGKIENTIKPTDKTIWIHCASLGEFEQGRPIIEKLRAKYHNHKIVLTFFSPSGYEVRKEYDEVDVVCYLPLDTILNAKTFIKLVHPKMAIFVKYEFWPSILNELQKNKVETILISGIFRKNQVFFKSFGGWMRKSLLTFTHFFVQDEKSQKLLKSIGFDNATVSGDTRFDRVFEITKQDNSLKFIKDFIQGKPTIVAGSTWKEDEKLLINYINTKLTSEEKFIIAPHNINPNEIKALKNSITKKTVLFSEIETNASLNEHQVFIIDTIGILTKIYSYASIAYVGGGFETGLHNVLEPATFGVPILIGPKYNKFNEAIELVDKGGCIVVNTQQDFDSQLQKLFLDAVYRQDKGNISKKYIEDNIGATTKILEYIASKISI